MINMKLKLEIVEIKDVQFGTATYIRDGVLFIDKQEMMDHLADPALEKVDIDIARPGESVRIVPVKDVIEPRIKMSEEGGSFPGFFGKFDGCGDGTTKALRGCVVTTAGRIVAFQEGLIDMSGVGTDYCYYSKLNNIVVIADAVEGLHPLKHEELMRKTGLKAANFIAKAAKEIEADEVEEYELKPAGDLPKVAYIYCVMAQGLLHDSYLYGMDCKKIHPTLLHPNEILDGALVSGNCVTAGDKNTTYDHQTNPVIAELFERHGVDLNFVGVIISPVCGGLADKVRCDTASVNIARQLGADAVIISEDGGGNPDADLMMLCKNAETKGIKTVLIIKENAGWDGTSEPITDSTPEADAVISVGNMNQLVTLPKMDRTIGYPECIKQLSGSCDNLYNPDGSINVSLAVIVSSINDIGKTKLSSDVY